MPKNETTPRRSEKTSNKNGEFLLDVCPDKREGSYTIYDITAFLPHWQGYERTRILKFHKFTIKGKEFTVLILDYWECLNQELATQIAKAWYLDDTDYHRLD